MLAELESPGLAVSLAEAQSYARAETGEEEALLVGLIRSATGICEQFLGQWLIVRPFEAVLEVQAGWAKLPVLPVRSIAGAETIANGAATTLDPSTYSVDIDADGRGWIRLGTAGRVRVTGEAGMASDPDRLPEPIRQGILRLTAHLFAHRDGTGAQSEPPAAVTALWRPYRRVQL